MHELPTVHTCPEFRAPGEAPLVRTTYSQPRLPLAIMKAALERKLGTTSPDRGVSPQTRGVCREATVAAESLEAGGMYSAASQSPTPRGNYPSSTSIGSDFRESILDTSREYEGSKDSDQSTGIFSGRSGISSSLLSLSEYFGIHSADIAMMELDETPVAPEQNDTIGVPSDWFSPLSWVARRAPFAWSAPSVEDVVKYGACGQAVHPSASPLVGKMCGNEVSHIVSGSICLGGCFLEDFADVFCGCLRSAIALDLERAVAAAGSAASFEGAVAAAFMVCVWRGQASSGSWGWTVVQQQAAERQMLRLERGAGSRFNFQVVTATKDKASLIQQRLTEDATEDGVQERLAELIKKELVEDVGTGAAVDGLRVHLALN